MDKSTIEELQARVRVFATERDWEQFHSPKNLAMALMVEAAELAEHFQWLDQSQSESLSTEKRREVDLELADVFIYLLRFADRMGVDLVDAAVRKLEINARKYPIDKARGKAAKYSEL